MPTAANVPAATKVDIVDATGDQDAAVPTQTGIEDADLSSPTFLQFLVFALIVLGVPVAVFIYCGGRQWIRQLAGGESSKGEYKRVRNQDLEK